MSAHYVYRLYDPKTGALLHEGTPTELVAAGLFPDRDRLQSEYMRQKKTVKKPRIWRIEREKRPPAATKTLLREVPRRCVVPAQRVHVQLQRVRVLDLRDHALRRLFLPGGFGDKRQGVPGGVQRTAAP